MPSPMYGPIDSPADWRGPELAQRTDWIYRLTAADRAEIEAGLDLCIAGGRPFADMTAADLPLPAFAHRLLHARDVLETGCGIFLFRGFAVAGRSVDDLRRLYWGIGRHIGTAVSQSKRGDMLGDVRDIGTDVSGREGRGYTSRAELEFHTDSADVSALFFLRTARAGGLSRFVSSVAIHNEIARQHSEFLKTLYEPFIWSRQGQEREGEAAWYGQPVYGVERGHFASRYIRTHVLSARRHHDAPPLTGLQSEALAAIDRLAGDPAFCLDMMLEPGDMVFLNSHTTYHARTEFEDHPEPARKRHLLRLWLSVPNSRPLPEGWSAVYRDRRPGAVRGGFPGHAEAPAYATE
ncbi:MAG: TauD/TfdA family dioxygenase [Rhodospirillaceae bacterium]|nr:TauD/TfdA family dioxygenase [Rhodospirillaceae bacterium]